MSLLAPLMLLGLLGLGLPLLAHLRGRDIPKPVRFAGLRFLGASEEVLTQRRRLRDGLLLLVRLALLALVVVALTRPVTTGDARVAVLGEPHDAVILLDASFSLSLETDGRNLRLAGDDAAAAILEALPPGSRVGLVTSDPAGPRLELSADPGRVRAAVATWAAEPPRGGAWPLEGGLHRAVALLRHAGDGPDKRVIYAIGDPTARGLGSLPEASEQIPVLPVPARGDLDAPPPVPEHLSLESADWAPARDIDPRAVRITGAVRRHGPQDAGERRVALALRIDGEIVARAEVAVPPGASAPYEFTHTATSAGPSAASVEISDLVGDPLPGDETRHLWLASEASVDVVLVNGDPSEMRAHDEVYFLATALAAGEDDLRLRVHGLAPDQLEARLRPGGDQLAGVDVLVLANVRAPAADIAPALRARVAAGMGLWITVGERVEARAYNDALGDLLPLLLREPLLVGTAPGRTEARTDGLAPPNLAHPLLLGLQGDLGLLGTRARRIFLLEPDAARGAEVALSFTSGAPALITRPYERGRVALLTTSIDRDWSDLPLRPGFVPLAARILTRLDTSHAAAAAAQIHAGEPREVPADQPVTVRTPDGRDVVVPADRGHATFTDTLTPGHYRVTRDGADDLTFAVQLDPAESDTTPVALQPRAASGDLVLSAAQHPRWRPLVLLAVLLLLAETLLRARAQRTAASPRAARRR
jgi:hypothetical protein